MKIKNNYLFFYVNNIHQAIEIISICKTKNILPILCIKFYLINGFGIDWIIEFRKLLLKNFKKKDFKILVNCRKNYGLFIHLVGKKIDFLKVEGDKHTLLKLKQIANINKITMNPKINIIDLTKIKKIETKINKYLIKKNE